MWLVHADEITSADRRLESHHASERLLAMLPGRNHWAYMEGQLTDFLHEDPADVGVLRQKYGALRSQALSVEKNVRLPDGLLGET
ncbi:hypothetical protein LRD69_23475 [Streptomyces sp. JH14]|uniref:hypothetical protein n=1 Tax=Streptomyces sp. JH14 TaxID=2793630 RepID=UPI0023F8D808|nr:hypothetical protein [Streptomyces sp. JH14]MDF6045058.1 hypothetical protein [Streptomyces sp. JH14]